MLSKFDQKENKKQNMNLNHKSFNESVFCIKCLDKSNNLLEFHNKFINLLDEFNFFGENENQDTNIKLNENKIKNLIPKYLQKVLDLMMKNENFINSSILLDNISNYIKGSEEIFNKDLDISLKEKINKLSEEIVQQKNKKKMKNQNLNQSQSQNQKFLKKNQKIMYKKKKKRMQIL